MLRQGFATLRCTRARTFSTGSRLNKDFVQEMYLKELKAYKPAPQAKDAHEGAVKAFSAPSAPKPPQLPSDLASELSAWDSEMPTLAESSSKTSTSSSDELGGAGAKEFLAFLEEDVPKPVHHH